VLGMLLKDVSSEAWSEEMADYCTELGMPLDGLRVRVVIPGAVLLGPGFEDYSIRGVGLWLTMPPEQEEFCFPFLRVRPGLVIQLWEQQVIWADSPVFARVSWLPGRELEFGVIGGSPTDLSGERYKRAQQGLQRYLTISKGGRRLGTGTWRDGEHFRAEIINIIRGLRAQSRPYTEDAVAEYMSRSKIHPSCESGQIRRWLRRYGLTWGQLIREAESRQ